jgi:hypothetical protein
MEGQFQAQDGFGKTLQEGFQAGTATDAAWAGQASQLADDIQGLLGDEFEPDALFLEESWMLGVDVAAANLRQRRQGRADREAQSRAFRELHNAGTVWAVEEMEPAEFLASAIAQKVARGYDSEWSQWDFELHNAPAKERPTLSEWETFGEDFDRAWETAQPMTLQTANRLLGVTPASTREQIKSAYRRMAGQWHPDRLERAGREVRELATERMVALNEAYQLLCNGLS